MQIQFNGYRYTVQVGNITFTVPGETVSNEGWGFPIQGLLRGQHPWDLTTCLCPQLTDIMDLNSHPLYATYLIITGISCGFLFLYYLSLKFIKQKSVQDW